MDVIHTTMAPAAIGVYSQAIAYHDLVFLSGQIPLDPETMNLISHDIHEQIVQVFCNLSAVCEAAGGALVNLVKVNVYLTNLEHFKQVNDIMLEYFSEPYPARAVIGVAALPRGASVEIDGIMIRPSV